MRVSTVFSAFAVSAMILGVSAAGARAGELDNEGPVTNVDQRALADALPATVVVRVAADGTVAVMHSSAALPAQPMQLADVGFVSMKLDATMSGPAKSELDHDSSTDSWRFWFNNYYNYGWYYPTYYYGGYNYYYTPYYNYWYGGYNYYYFRWRRW